MAELRAILMEQRFQDAARELMQLEYDMLNRGYRFQRTLDSAPADLVRQLLAPT
jgi:hypothetical protein